MYLIPRIWMFSVFLNDQFNLWSPSSMLGKLDKLLIITRHQSITILTEDIIYWGLSTLPGGVWQWQCWWCWTRHLENLQDLLELAKHEEQMFAEPGVSWRCPPESCWLTGWNANTRLNWLLWELNSRQPYLLDHKSGPSYWFHWRRNPRLMKIIFIKLIFSIILDDLDIFFLFSLFWICKCCLFAS